MTNEYGLNVSYFKEKLSLIIRDIGNYTPREMYNALSRLADVANEESDGVPENFGKDEDYIYENIDKG